MDEITIKEVKKIAVEMGPYVNTLIATKDSFLATSKRALRAMFLACAHLENVQLARFDLSNARTIEKLSKIFATAKTIKLRKCRLTDEVVMELLKDAKYLEALDLSRNPWQSGKFLTEILGIVDLNLSFCKEIETKYFIEFFKMNPNLRCLNIERYWDIDCEFLQALRKLESLESLTMPFPARQDFLPREYVILSDLPNLRHLKRCNAYSNNNVRDEFLESLSNSHHLECLDISHMTINEVNVEVLANFQYLRVLKMNSVMGELDQLMMQFKGNDVLQELHIASNTITPAVLLEFIKKCPSLRYINLSQTWGLSLNFLRDIIPHLKTELEIRHNVFFLEIRETGGEIAELIKGKIKLSEPDFDFLNSSEDDYEDFEEDDDE